MRWSIYEFATVLIPITVKSQPNFLCCGVNVSLQYWSPHITIAWEDLKSKQALRRVAVGVKLLQQQQYANFCPIYIFKSDQLAVFFLCHPHSCGVEAIKAIYCKLNRRSFLIKKQQQTPYLIGLCNRFIAIGDNHNKYMTDTLLNAVCL